MATCISSTNDRNPCHEFIYVRVSTNNYWDLNHGGQYRTKRKSRADADADYVIEWRLCRRPQSVNRFISTKEVLGWMGGYGRTWLLQRIHRPRNVARKNCREEIGIAWRILFEDPRPVSDLAQLSWSLHWRGRTSDGQADPTQRKRSRGWSVETARRTHQQVRGKRTWHHHSVSRGKLFAIAGVPEPETHWKAGPKLTNTPQQVMWPQESRRHRCWASYLKNAVWRMTIRRAL